MISYLITFVAGAFTGAAGKYLADKYTDKRRNQEQKVGERKTFSKVAGQMAAGGCQGSCHLSHNLGHLF